jgi:hypothetical protein
LLLGRTTSTGDETIRTVAELWAAENAWNAEAAALISDLLNCPQMSHSKGDRYWIDPAEMLAAMKHGRDRQLDIIGVYHSHPDRLAALFLYHRVCLSRKCPRFTILEPRSKPLLSGRTSYFSLKLFLKFFLMM